MLAVLTGLGQRRTLLSPLISIRQPKMTRSVASVSNTIVECSNGVLLLLDRNGNFGRNIVSSVNSVKSVAMGTINDLLARFASAFLGLAWQSVGRSCLKMRFFDCFCQKISLQCDPRRC